MQTLTLNAWGSNHPITFHLANYADNDNLYVGMITHDDPDFPEPWSDLTVNLGTPLLMDCAFIDTNNNPGILDWLEANNLGKRSGNKRQSGFCTYEIFYFNMDELMQYVSYDSRGK
jgi:hypothetical protein